MPAAGALRSRSSIAFFMHADQQAMVSSSKHGMMTAGDYMQSRINSSYAASSEGGVAAKL
jgi:hypothetical protein